MSFTSEIKKEICKEEIDAQMMKAQLCALFQMRASLHMNWQGMYLSFQTENATIAKHVFQIMKTLYDVDPRLSVLKKMQVLKVFQYYIVKNNLELRFFVGNPQHNTDMLYREWL